MTLLAAPTPTPAIALATGSVEMHVWEQDAGATLDGSVTRARIVNVLHGELRGDGVLDCLFHECAPGRGTFVGLEHVTGTLCGRIGSFVLRHSGTWDGPTTVGVWTVVEGSGTGELEGLRGEGGYGRDADDVPAPYVLEWALA